MKKSGNMIYTVPIVISVSIVVITVIGLLLVQNIIPFIWYQKLNNIALKYMFVVEKFGYLTDSEKQNLIEEMTEHGFDRAGIYVDVTSGKQNYGELVYLEILYNLNQDMVDFSSGKLGIKKRTIPIHVRKNSYSKI